MTEQQTPNIPFIAVTGAVSGVLLLVIVIGLQAWYLYQERSAQMERLADYKPSMVTELKARQLGDLSSSREVTLDNGTVRQTMPITDAMEKLVAGGLPKQPSTRPAR